MSDLEALIGQLTLEEKAALCTGKTAWTTVAVERLGLPELLVSDGPHGVRRIPDATALTAPSLPATCFPTASCLAATWDVELIRELGEALAEECRALGVDVLLGPGNNMKRTPLCGRNFEYFSEDPFLAGELAATFISAVQSRGVGTSLKHYAANNQEFQRFTINAIVDERTLREIYLAGFETAVKRGKPWTVMCAYNRLNGSYCSEHRALLTDILKNEWGFEGVVVSDWGAVHDRVAALRGGLDLAMPGPSERHDQAVIAAVRAGQLDEAQLDDSVRRIVGTALKAKATPKGGSFDAEAHHALARRIAAEGMVLLKNDGVLPLQQPRRIAVIGRAAKVPYFQGGGSSHVNPTRQDVPLEAIQQLAGSAAITFAEGYPSDDRSAPTLIAEAVEQARAADVALLFIALPAFIESEGYDRAGLALTPQQVSLIRAVSEVQPRTVVILNNGSAVSMTEWLPGVGAVVEAYLMGQAGGSAVADVLFGKVNPSGKLAETFPLALEDTPAYLNFPGGNGEVRYGEGIFIGYRYYDARRVPVLFPFGHGLSYTQFSYGPAIVSATRFKDVDGLRVSVDVTNTGAVRGKEVVQVYVHDRKAKLVRPPKELKGFAKVELAPGETRRVTLTLDFRAFAYYHPAYAQWITEDGEFEILVGSSSADIRASATVTLESTLRLPCLLHRESTVSEWLEDAQGQAVFLPFFDALLPQLIATFGTGDVEGGIGMETHNFMRDMPLLALLTFHERLLPEPAERIVDGLLTQAHQRAIEAGRPARR